MTRDLAASTLARLEDDVVYPVYAVVMYFDDTDGTLHSESGYAGENVVRLWTGGYDVTIDGNVYVGAGSIVSISSVTETADISAEGTLITLAGVPLTSLALALTSQYQGRRCDVLFALMDPDRFALSKYTVLDPEGTPTLEETAGYADALEIEFSETFSGRMDQMNIVEGADVATIEMSVENKLITLERPRSLRYTSAILKTRFPSDLGLDFVESIQDQEIVWGRA